MKVPYSKIGRWIAELILVFVGVYAAFWLNSLQQHHQEAKRRDQILASLERLLEDGIANTKEQTAKQDREMAAFQHALQAGEMPPIRRFTFTTDYNPGDIATLLQSGGIELLEVRTLTALRELESVIRWGLSRMAHYQKLSDELIAPNLDQEKTFFYEPSGRELRKRFDIYPEALQEELKFFRELDQKQAQLLRQIQTERQRH
jgi:hypothetical protein